MKVQNGLKRVVFGMEPTANYHKPLGEHLIRCGHLVVLVSGVAACENRKTLDGRWDTNDTRDAANVADLVSQGKFLFYEFPVGVLQDLRNLLSLKRRFKRVEQGYRVRIRNHLLAKYFPELDRCHGPLFNYVNPNEYIRFISTIVEKVNRSEKRDWKGNAQVGQPGRSCLKIKANGVKNSG